LETGIPARLSKAELRKFGLTLGPAFVVLGTVARWRGHPIASTVLWTLGAALVAGGAAVPAALAPVHRAWMGLAAALSKVTTPIFLGVVYFGIFTPVGIVKRAFGHNGLVQPLQDGSYFRKRERRVSGSMENMF
jgi:hypothetical protein